MRSEKGEAMEKMCEACGAGFECRAGGCWCGAVAVPAAVRDELRARFADCLCRACLERLAAAGDRQAAQPDANAS